MFIVFSDRLCATELARHRSPRPSLVTTKLLLAPPSRPLEHIPSRYVLVVAMWRLFTHAVCLQLVPRDFHYVRCPCSLSRAYSSPVLSPAVSIFRCHSRRPWCSKTCGRFKAIVINSAGLEDIEVAADDQTAGLDVVTAATEHAHKFADIYGEYLRLLQARFLLTPM